MENLEEVRGLRVWLVHDWLTGMRGGEKVLLELVRLFPKCRIATLVHVKGSTHPEIDAKVARTSFLQRVPGAGKGYRNMLPLFPRAVRGLELDGECDVVISSSHAVVKNVRVPAGVRHLCYCHTPMRYIWGLESHYVKRWSAKGAALRAVQGYLRRQDLAGTSGVTRFVANSRTVAERIGRIYGREAAVVHPGIDEAYWTRGNAAGDFFLVVSALVPYKRVDLAIGAARITGQKLIIIGKGPEETRLRKLAADLPQVNFAGWQPDEVIREHYQRCLGMVFPGEEDFGLTPVEVQACGRPVVAYGRGGATETVVPGTGIFFYRQTAAALAEAMQACVRRSWDGEEIRKNALRFTWAHFREGILREVKGMMRGAMG